MAQAYEYGFCTGVAEMPPANHFTRVFALGPTSGDFSGEFMQALGQKYPGTVRRDATGCRMFPTASEAEQARSHLLEQFDKPPVVIDWLPKGATALTTTTPPSGAKANGSTTPAAQKPR